VDAEAPDSASPGDASDGGVDAALPDAPDLDAEEGDSGLTDSGDGGSGAPEIALSVAEGEVLTGVVEVEVTLEPAAGWVGVELSLGDTKVATLTTSPWSFSLDTTAFADGAAVLRAIATRADGSGSVDDEVSVVLANFSPVVVVDSPAEASEVIAPGGSAFLVVPKATASDGNGIASFEVEVDGASYPVDGITAVPLVPPGEPRELPRPVSFRFVATDATGAKTEVLREVVATNAAFSRLVSTGYQFPFVNRVEPAADGGVWVQVGASTSVGGAVLGLDAQLSTLSEYNAGQPQDAFFSESTATFGAWVDGESRLLRQPLGAEASVLLTVGAAEQANLASVRPVADALGRLWVTVVRWGKGDTQLLAYGEAPTPAIDATHPGVLLDGTLVPSGGDFDLLLAVSQTGPSTAGRLVPVDATTGALGAPFPAPSDVNVIAVAGVLEGIAVARGQGPATSGPPAERVLAYALPGGELLFAVELPLLSSLWRVLEAGPDSVSVWLAASSPDAVGGVFRLGASGPEALWTPQPGRVAWLAGAYPDGDLLAAATDYTLGATSLTRISAEGEVRFEQELEGLIAGAVTVTADEVALYASQVGFGEPLTLHAVDTDGNPQWSAPIEATELRGIATEPAGALIALAQPAAPPSPQLSGAGLLRYEWRNLTDGALVWAHTRGPLPAGAQAWNMLRLPAQGAWVVPLTAYSEGESGTWQQLGGVLGLLP
jgi:hypothetical protein